MKLKIVVVLCLVMVFSVLTVGCRNTQQSGAVPSITGVDVVDGVSMLSFAQNITLSDLDKLDGHMVSLTGYLSTVAGEQARVVYLKRNPFGGCPFCELQSAYMDNTIAVNPKNYSELVFSGVPFTVVGRLEVGEATDERGYTYNHRIVDAEVVPADLIGMSESVRIHAGLLGEGFVGYFSNVMSWVYGSINQKTLNLTPDTLPQLDATMVLELQNIVNGGDTEYHKQLQVLVSDLGILIGDIEKYITAENWEGLLALNTRGQELYDRFTAWLQSPEI